MNRLKRIGTLAAVVALLPILLVYMAVYLVWWFTWGLVLRLWFWWTHAKHGRPVLLVTSDSPNWRAYIDEQILPRIAGRAVVLNWSQRNEWPARTPWEARFFHRFAGERDFNPLALVMCANGRVAAVRFHRAFFDFTHGDEAALREAERELFGLVEGRG